MPATHAHGLTNSVGGGAGLGVVGEFGVAGDGFAQAGLEGAQLGRVGQSVLIVAGVGQRPDRFVAGQRCDVP
jgi:hypothetical protein